MIKVETTPNITGVKISGDYNDLYVLVGALHEIAILDDDIRNSRYLEMSNRILGLCYDIRHAFQGDREIMLAENGMDEDLMKVHSIIAPKNNVYFSCNCLYPEMFFVMLALNKLVELRIRALTKNTYIFSEALDKKVVWDMTITQVRLLQAAFAECMKGTLSEGSFSRWLNFMNGRFSVIESLTTQYIDLLNLKFISMPKEKRLKNLNVFAKRIAEFEYDMKHKEISIIVREGAKQYECPPGEIMVRGHEYPEEIEW
ncbi:DUF6904 family protein [Youngiibacter multivorans]|uniref:Uncharacterized protein n=1 Tax=Youngiibacter multivorans TaxID=937251 RepID=A0ABS4G6I6_9CLOT|nr:hypothetical protein [Youngiibacter multivorans]MBP1919895.1 hypothetical protein [Youngiibacter multivorans]